MEIKPSEIKSVEECGSLDGQPVKMITTLGGLVMLAGNPKGKGLTILSASNHPAIASHMASKAYSGYQAPMQKSEHESEGQVNTLTQFLPSAISDSGLDLHSVKKHNQITYSLSKFGKEIGSAKAILKDNSLVMQKSDSSLAGIKGFAQTLLNITARDAIENKKDFVVLNGKSFAARRMI